MTGHFSKRLLSLFAASPVLRIQAGADHRFLGIWGVVARGRVFGAWALSLVQAYALKGDTANVRTYAEEARKAMEEQLRAAPDDPGRLISHGLALAYLGRKEEAIREGQRCVAFEPMSKDAVNGPYFQHQLARTYILNGEPEKALDQLEPLPEGLLVHHPRRLRIDPNFDPRRGNPRFQKLVGGKG